MKRKKRKPREYHIGDRVGVTFHPNFPREVEGVQWTDVQAVRPGRLYNAVDCADTHVIVTVKGIEDFKSVKIPTDFPGMRPADEMAEMYEDYLDTLPRLKKKRTPEEVAQRLLQLWAEGEHIDHLINHPKECLAQGVDPRRLRPSVIARARRLMSEYDQDLRNRIREINRRAGYGERGEKLRVRWNETSSNPNSPTEPTKQRTKLFNFPLTSVVRWMGSEHWTLSEARRVLERMGFDIADNTILTQLGAGKNGKRGEPADLSPAQANQLYEHLR